MSRYMIHGSQSWFWRPVPNAVGQPPAFWYSVGARTTPRVRLPIR